jgi:hypothetical protein
MDHALADLQHFLEDAVLRVRTEVAAGRLSAPGADALLSEMADLCRRSRALILAAWST